MARTAGKKPKGKLSSYLLFFITFKEQYKTTQAAQSPNAVELSKKCSEKWKAMSAEEKKKYEEMAKQHNAQYAKKKKSNPLRGVRRVPNTRDRKKSRRTKKPLPAFFLFMADHRPALKKSNPRWTVVDVAKELGAMWHKQPEKDKDRYKQKAAQMRQKTQKKKETGMGGSQKGSQRRGKKMKEETSDFDRVFC